jgi:CHASE2 domain-containing sensor protein
MPMAVLFSVLALGLLVIAAAAARAGAWVPAVGAAALSGWMGTVALGAFRRRA